MNSRDFCYWLQGFFELTEEGSVLSAKQTQAIKNHLNMVFKHEIDPSYGDKKHQEELSGLHGMILGKIPPASQGNVPVAHDHVHPGDVLLRC